MAFVRRDPYARTEIHKEWVCDAVCVECGHQSRKGRGCHGAYRFRVESDGGRVWPDVAQRPWGPVPLFFCSLPCRRGFLQVSR